MSCLATCGKGEVAAGLLYAEGMGVGRVVGQSLGTDDWTGEALTLLFSPVSPEGPKGLLLWMDKELCLLIRPLRG